MRVKFTAIGRCAALASLLLFAASSHAEEAAAPPSQEELIKIMAEAGKPGPEHEKLEPLAGSWTYTSKHWMNPSEAPVESHGVIERKWILGGRFLEERIEGTGLDGKPGFEAFGLLGYDSARKTYTLTWACNMGTGVCTGQGVADGSGVFTFQTEAFCPVMNKTIQGRDEIRVESDDKMVVESYLLEDGEETKMMEIVATRRK